MITRAEYLEALEKIDCYHRQMEKPTTGKTPINKWLLTISERPSQRLRIILEQIYSGGYAKYIEDVTEGMMKNQGTGLKFLQEFDYLRREND